MWQVCYGLHTIAEPCGTNGPRKDPRARGDRSQGVRAARQGDTFADQRPYGSNRTSRSAGVPIVHLSGRPARCARARRRRGRSRRWITFAAPRRWASSAALYPSDHRPVSWPLSSPVTLGPTTSPGTSDPLDCQQSASIALVAKSALSSLHRGYVCTSRVPQAHSDYPHS